jgi:hypothetical protein
MKDAKGHGSNPRNGDTPVVRLDTVGSPNRKTGYKGSAKQETLAMQRVSDEGRNPTSTITDRMAAMTLGQGHPKSGGVPFGYGFEAAKMNLDRGRNVALPRGAENRRKS